MEGDRGRWPKTTALWSAPICSAAEAGWWVSLRLIANLGSEEPEGTMVTDVSSGMKHPPAESVCDETDLDG